MSLDFTWNLAASPQIELNIFTKFIRNIQMSWKPRNQNNIIPIAKGIANKKQVDQANRLNKLIASIEAKMQQPYWDVLLFDDAELEVMANFGETLKFPSETTAVRAMSILSTYILKKHSEDSYE